MELESEEPFSFEVPKLVLPTSLKKLALIRCGSELPPLMINYIGPLPNLEVLKLRKFNFWKQRWITSEQGFPKLRLLLIDDSNLRQWDSEGSHFPVLEHLILHSCRSLSRLAMVWEKSRRVKDYMESLACTIKQMQEEQLEYGDDVFQLRCIRLEPVAKLPLPMFSASKVKKKKKVIKKRRVVPRGLHPVRDMLKTGY